MSSVSCEVPADGPGHLTDIRPVASLPPTDVDDILADDAPRPLAVQVWALDIGRRPVFLTMNTPVAAQSDQQCGRLVEMDTHVTTEKKDAVTDLARCDKTLNKAEHVLAFMLF